MGENDVDMNFFNIVISISQAAMLGMGKIANPQTGKVEKSMEIAKVNIDILQMFKDKTKGNLSKKENEILTDSLANLQLTYADEIKKEPSEKKEEEKPAEKAEGKAVDKKEEQKEEQKEETEKPEKK